jgi:outer membrane protein OmpA-like peptidoglycan-associated protein
MATLRNYAVKLKDAKAVHVLIIGNIDEIKPHSNRWASMVATENVRDFLVSEGVPTSIFEVRPEGALNPIKPKGSAYNNRVETKVTRIEP